MAYGIQIAEDITGVITTFPRINIVSSGNQLASGVLHLSHFTPSKTLTAVKVFNFTGPTAAGATPTLCRTGIYSLDATHANYTLIGSTPNDTSTWSSAFTGYTRTLSSSVTLTPGTRYAIGLLCISTATMPSLYSSANAMLLTSNFPRTIATVSGQTDLPATIAQASLGFASSCMFFSALLDS